MEKRKRQENQGINLSPQDVVLIILKTYCIENQKKTMEINLLAMKCVIMGAGKKTTALKVIENMVAANSLQIHRGKGKRYVSPTI